jgi:hypothetical protein
VGAILLWLLGIPIPDVVRAYPCEIGVAQSFGHIIILLLLLWH